MRKIQLVLNDIGFLVVDEKNQADGAIAGRAGEWNAAEFLIRIPQQYENAGINYYRLLFHSPADDIFQSEQLVCQQGILCCKMPPNAVAFAGTLVIQLCGYGLADGEIAMIFKSGKCLMQVGESLGEPNTEISADLVLPAEKLLNRLEQLDRSFDVTVGTVERTAWRQDPGVSVSRDDYRYELNFQLPGSIPPDSANAFAAALEQTQTGRVVVADDVQSETDFISLTAMGSTVERLAAVPATGDKSPDRPVSFDAVQNPVIRVWGKNLMNADFLQIVKGVGAEHIALDHDEGSVTVLTYAPAAASVLYFDHAVWLSAGQVYTLRAADSMSFSTAIKDMALIPEDLYAGSPDSYPGGGDTRVIGTGKYSGGAFVFTPPWTGRFRLGLYLTDGQQPVILKRILFCLAYGQDSAPAVPFVGATEYSPHTPFPLHSLPNGVCDTADYISGLRIRRIGLMELTGVEESWTKTEGTENNLTVCFETALSARTDGPNGSSCRCNCLEVRAENDLLSADMKQEGMCLSFAAPRAGSVCIRIFKTRLPGWKDNLTDEQKTALFQSWLAARYAQ